MLLGNGTTTRIDHVQVGDWVQATDPDTGKTIAEPVTAVIITHTDRDYTDTTIATADGATTTVTSTQHHRFYDVTRHAWVHATDLDPGDLLREPDGTWATVTGIRNYHSHTTTYNLTVHDLHTYYVVAGHAPILVHNCSGGRSAECAEWRNGWWCSPKNGRSIRRERLPRLLCMASSRGCCLAAVARTSHGLTVKPGWTRLPLATPGTIIRIPESCSSSRPRFIDSRGTLEGFLSEVGDG